ncbi:MAG TPA: beta-ketoacyl synthase N-terminal-like domain-containing protein, partial [Ktedonobacterales bacterium]
MGRSDEGAWQPGLENLSAPRQRMPEGHPRQDDIRDWLIAQVANRLQSARSEIDPREPFTAFGMDSAAAVGLSGDLQDWLGLQLSPTLLWEHPSIEALSAYLATRLTAGEMESAGATESRWMQPTREPIAIVGIGCRLPGAPNPRALWRLLRAGGDAITEVPTDRWDMRAVYDPAPATPGKMTSRWGGFLDQVDQFDAAFFGIAPREASAMDPQQRLLLEVTWEALEDAGLVPGRLAGAAVGVFVGISSNDYGQMQMSDVQHISAYSGTGSALSIAANRISYVLDVRGPSVAIDTACSSSLVAVHQACHSLWSGESALAVAGGVNIILSPAVTVNFSQAGVLSPDGHCKAFDARADGYVRGEGAGAIVLKPLSRALRDGDPIYAVIRGSAVNHDGRSNGLMAPNPHAQEDLLREAYRQAGVSPGQVNYVEAQALGVLLGDSIEARALGVVMSVDRPAGSHCMIGSIKTNIGHLEAASGIAGLIKVALTLVHGELPASLHFQEPNPHIPFADLPLRVQRETGPWPAHTGPALAGVSAFGFGGTNAHIVLEEAPARPVLASPGDTSDQRQAYLLPLSARDPHALSMLAQAYHSYLVSDAGTATSLRDLCYTASVRRGHADHRLSVVAHSRDAFAQSLAAISRGETWPGASVGRALPGRRPKVAFVFPGQGIEWIGMARDLVERELPFRGMLAQCEQAFREYVDWSLFDVLAADESTSRPRQPDVASPTLFAIEVALAAVWRAWGIEPDAVVGHGTGEVAAAFVAGAISLADAARIICRGSQRASHDEL